MKKMNLKGFLITMLTLIVIAFILFLLVDTLGIPVYLVIIIVVVVLIAFTMLLGNKVASKAYESRFQRLKECKKCKKIIPAESMECPFCGVELENE